MIKQPMLKKSPVVKPFVYRIGDEIVLTEGPHKGQKGILIKKENEIWCVEFYNNFCSIQSKLNGLILSKNGLKMNQNRFSLSHRYNHKKKEIREFILNKIEDFYAQKALLALKLTKNKIDIYYSKKRIKELEKDITYHKNNTISLKTNLKKIKKNISAEINYKEYFKEYKRVKKLVEKIQFEDGIMYVTTKPLVYKKNERVNEFPLGRYLLRFASNSTMIAVNLDRQMNKGNFFHPCIKSNNFNICWGESRPQVLKLEEDNNIIFLIGLFCNFVQEPNYGVPYVNDIYFQYAQPVTIKPKKLCDYFNDSYWINNEKWDSDLFNQQTNDSTRVTNI